MEPSILLAGLAVALGLAVVAWLVLRNRSAAGAPSFAGLRERDFESLVAEAFRAQGYEPIQVARGGPTARAGELVLRRERVTYLVDCRHRHTGKVGEVLLQICPARGIVSADCRRGGDKAHLLR